jgi:hypothetical protein
MGVVTLGAKSRFGPYALIRCIASGGMGVVCEAEDTLLGHRVALKLLHAHIAARPGASVRFLREGRAAARVRHPHVVQVFALGEEQGTAYIAMELVDGDDLSKVLRRRGILGVEDALDLVLPVIAAVAAAHDAGVIHRDLKPSNVCIASRMGGHPWPKVVDFGVSKVIAADGALASTITDAIVGTAPYMAPEQAQAGSNASFGSDQYSLAVLLYKCVTGDLPFSGRSVYETLQSMMTAPLAPPSSRVSCAQRIPPALDAAVLRAMSRNPADRFPSVRDLGAALLPLASERTRLAMGRELREQAITVSDWEAPSQVVSATVLPEGDASGSLATEQDTKALRQRRRGRAGVVGLLAVAGLLLATVAATRRDEPSAASTPPTALSVVAIATPALPAAASRAPSAARPRSIPPLRLPLRIRRPRRRSRAQGPACPPPDGSHRYPRPRRWPTARMALRFYREQARSDPSLCSRGVLGIAMFGAGAWSCRGRAKGCERVTDASGDCPQT